MPADSLHSLLALQRTMARAVYGDAAAFRSVAQEIAGAELSPAKRLFVHLNTVDQALAGVLRQAYPATVRLLGVARFDPLAKAFLRATPPARPVLSAYGAGFARFLAGRGDLPAAAEAVARLDWAAHEAYFAEDATALAAAELAALPAERQLQLRLPLVPSARLVGLAEPEGWRRWAALNGGGGVVLLSAAVRSPAGGLVWRRPDLTVAARPLNVGELACLSALAAGRTLLEAAATAALDLAALLTDCLAGGVFRAPAEGPN